MSNERGRLRAVPSVLGDIRLPTPRRTCKRSLCGNAVGSPERSQSSAGLLQRILPQEMQLGEGGCSGDVP